MLTIDINLRNSVLEDNNRSKEEILMERFEEHAKWVKQAAKKMLGTIKLLVKQKTGSTKYGK